MDYDEAKRLLDIENISYKELRSKFKEKILLHHPDKRGNSEDFIKVREAYEFLLNNIDKECAEDSQGRNVTNMYDFLRDHLSKVSLDDIKNIYTMFYNGEKYELLHKFQDFLIKNADKIQLSEQLMSMFKKASERKSRKIVLLQPSLTDLLGSNVYKMALMDSVINVPLWHDELVYEINDVEYLIKIIPALDPHINILDDSLVFDLHYSIRDIWTLNCVYFYEGLWFDKSQLHLTDKQQLILYGQGLPLINTKNVYDTKRCGNIILNITLSA
jgi:hypothetical protein